MIAALCRKTLFAPMAFEGYCNGAVFEVYIEKVLIKELKPTQIVIMDNISFHKTERIKELIESVGAKILFLPPYSPDLNPIEHYWFKIKNEIRKSRDKFEDFFDAVCYVMDNVTKLVG